MKNKSKLICMAVLTIVIVSCKKKETSLPTTATPTPTTETYTSINSFFSKNAVPMQTYVINAGTGGSFTSPQGTTVTIPANAFLTKSGVLVTGNVTIQFKDLYKKSDMLLSRMPTTTFGGSLLKSSGEFFIKASAANATVVLASGKKIDINQPAALTGGIDQANLPQAFVAIDTVGLPWTQTNIDSVRTFSQNYIFSLYQYNAPVDSGSWCNSDNSSYFSAYPQTQLTLKTVDSVSVYGTEVFLVFKNISSMVHVYSYDNVSFPYSYAPQGLQCTVVAVGVKGGQLYSAFVPITISANQIVNFTLSPTTTSTFTTALQALN